MQVAGLQEDTTFYLENIMLNIKHLMAVMGEVTDNQHYYMTWKLVGDYEVGNSTLQGLCFMLFIYIVMFCR